MILRHYKGEPNVYVIRYRAGKLQQHGQGLDFWYLIMRKTELEELVARFNTLPQAQFFWCTRYASPFPARPLRHLWCSEPSMRKHR